MRESAEMTLAIFAYPPVVWRSASMMTAYPPMALDGAKGDAVENDNRCNVFGVDSP